jgi:hypothetical protein
MSAVQQPRSQRRKAQTISAILAAAEQRFLRDGFHRCCNIYELVKLVTW